MRSQTKGEAKNRVGRKNAPRATKTSLKKLVRRITPREKQVLGLIWAGYKNRETAYRLEISVKTVEIHRANMMHKLGVSNTAQLLRAGIEAGILQWRSI